MVAGIAAEELIRKNCCLVDMILVDMIPVADRMVEDRMVLAQERRMALFPYK